MIIPDKKKTATVILSRMGSAGHENVADVKPESEIGENEQALKDIADQVLVAVKAGSSHDLMLALQAFMDECQDGATDEA